MACWNELICKNPTSALERARDDGPSQLVALGTETRNGAETVFSGLCRYEPIRIALPRAAGGGRRQAAGRRAGGGERGGIGEVACVA